MSGFKDARDHPDAFKHVLSQFDKVIAKVTDVAKNKADPYGDGDQSIHALTGFGKAQDLRDLWGSGADFNPGVPGTSPWMQALYFGNLAEVTRLMAAEPDDAARRRLIERRETRLRMSALLTCIAGARGVPKMVRPAGHVEIARMLIAAGARVDAKDVAGYTPLHHCTTMYASPTSVEIMKLLLAAGADPNAVNRFGMTPLLEIVNTAVHTRGVGDLAKQFGQPERSGPWSSDPGWDAMMLDVLQRLCDAGANPTAVDPGSKHTAWQMARLWNDAMAIFGNQATRMARATAMRETGDLTGKRVKLVGLKAADLNGQLGTCGELDPAQGRCSVTLDSGRQLAVRLENLQLADHRICELCGAPAQKKCSRCVSVYYCSVEHQRQHWAAHKPSCTAKKADFTDVPDSSSSAFKIFNYEKAAMFESTEEQTRKLGKKPFKVKIQVPTDEGGLFSVQPLDTQPLLLYNRDRSFKTMMQPSHPQYRTIWSMVDRDGVKGPSGRGAKGYFNAMCNDSGKVCIDTTTMLPAQDW